MCRTSKHQKIVKSEKKIEAQYLVFRNDQKSISPLLAKKMTGRRTSVGNKDILHWYTSWIDFRISYDWKVRAHLEKRSETPHTHHRKDLISSKEKHKWAILADSSQCRYDKDETGLILTKNCKINSFVIKSILEPHCKRLSKSEKRENFNPKLDPHMRKSHSK